MAPPPGEGWDEAPRSAPVSRSAPPPWRVSSTVAVPNGFPGRSHRLGISACWVAPAARCLPWSAATELQSEYPQQPAPTIASRLAQPLTQSQQFAAADEPVLGHVMPQHRQLVLLHQPALQFQHPHLCLQPFGRRQVRVEQGLLFTPLTNQGHGVAVDPLVIGHFVRRDHVGAGAVGTVPSRSYPRSTNPRVDPALIPDILAQPRQFFTHGPETASYLLLHVLWAPLQARHSQFQTD